MKFVHCIGKVTEVVCETNQNSSFKIKKQTIIITLLELLVAKREILEEGSHKVQKPSKQRGIFQSLVIFVLFSFKGKVRSAMAQRPLPPKYATVSCAQLNIVHC